MLALQIFALDCNCCERNICIDSEETTHSDSGTVCAGITHLLRERLYHREKSRQVSSDGESAVTLNPADCNTNAPGSTGRGESGDQVISTSGSPRSSSPSCLESPISRGPLPFFVNLDYFPTYLIVAYTQLNAPLRTYHCTNPAREECIQARLISSLSLFCSRSCQSALQ